MDYGGQMTRKQKDFQGVSEIFLWCCAANYFRINGEWCGQEDLNFQGLSPTTTSTLRVYQFRHGRTIDKTAKTR